MNSDIERLRERTRRRVLRTLGMSFGAAALATGAILTAADDDREREQEAPAERDDRSEPLFVHGPTTIYPANEHHQPGVFGELENISERTVWLARYSVTFYDESERAVGTRSQYFVRVRPGEQRSIEIPFTADWFDDRSWTIDRGLQVVL